MVDSSHLGCALKLWLFNNKKVFDTVLGILCRHFLDLATVKEHGDRSRYKNGVGAIFMYNFKVLVSFNIFV